MDNINVIVIVLDTLRRDYGLFLKNSMEQLGFVYYDNAISTSSWTLPSHASIFTGLYPAFHGVHGGTNKDITSLRLGKSLPLLSRDLFELGYETILVSANPFITPNFGFRYFNKFHNIYRTLGWLSENEKNELHRLKLKYKVQSRVDLIHALLSTGHVRILLKLIVSYSLNRIGIIDRDWPLDKGVKKALSVFKSMRPSKIPRFIFVNLMEAHEPYLKNDPFKQVRKHNLKTNSKLPEKYLSLWRHAYRMEVQYLKNKLLEILRMLKSNDLFDSSLIIITSDHGQLLGEYNRIGHGVFLYDELIRVPLFIHYPIEQLDVEFDKGSRFDMTKYFSLIKLRKLILDAVKHGYVDEATLFTDTVFSENYGSSINEPPKTEEEKRNLEQLNKYRIAIYYNGFKGIFNVNDWKFEEVNNMASLDISYDEALKGMRKAVLNFLKLSIANKKIKKLE
ncbi:sulfatase-like hydrolase/transferase [Pyrococcus sp. ST04]|uniref:sulfatase-like hydrolase/transferase n=1 Tax=Pyrococcus sp. ST04 TaxID=1183377 RepID=UPI0002605A99|nr:sulfatase-like hydrolase/transferase [Pyrococcus sp. ST04]AFK22090.1 hypothetical protein Py04_0488 [Pyrococcus sp. ST04]